MIKLIVTLILVLIICRNVKPLMALDRGHGEGYCSSCHFLTERESYNLLRQTGGIVKSIKQAPVPGLFELLMEKKGQQGTIYIDYGKKFLIQGLIINLDTLQPVMSHTDELLVTKHISQVDIASIPLDKAIVMGNPRGTKKIYVFTDPDCPYCYKLHNELKKLEKISADLAICVLICPLSQHPNSIEKARSLLEIKTPHSLDMAFDGKQLPKPVQESSKADINILLGVAASNGISGTPSIVFSDGSKLVGVMDADSIKKLLDKKEAKLH